MQIVFIRRVVLARFFLVETNVWCIDWEIADRHDMTWSNPSEKQGEETKKSLFERQRIFPPTPVGHL